MSATLGPNGLMGTYEELAAEYYDAVRHPTCANFREASSYVLASWLDAETIPLGDVCEVGPGRSVVAEHIVAQGRAIERLTLVDSSPSMLAHSTEWINRGACAVVGDATQIPLEPESADVIVASLGDPYNVPEFWREAYRVVRPGGQAFFTTPSYAWAIAFRRTNAHEAMGSALFELADGRRRLVPSFILPPREQVVRMERAGFVLTATVEIPVSVVTKHPKSPKLLAARRDKASIVTGYRLAKPAGTRME